eukprot:TRINITY_DN14463_c0_g1_i1.p1 TRINITY_DN14463_c0_g1~~TRINITY_DN14463_c0_g1_i1.p1  ORF type:complete len:321 (+),score=100.23 TRINITY_DN14463_c0_g1_i1:72-1034(+)
MTTLRALVAASAVAAAEAVWPALCPTNSTPATRCDAAGTCCPAHYSVSGYGCCAWADAVCCAPPPGSTASNCCPAGTVCRHSGSGLGVVTDCVDAHGAVVVQGRSVCKPGAPLPASAAKKNVLIIGDSVSIGYTPVVAELLADIALVQHAPWDTSDGGAEETAYGAYCLKYFLHSPEGVPVAPDVVLFNWGLHDGPLGNATIPGQQGNTTRYNEQLRAIAADLAARLPAAQLLFALTTPYVCASQNNGCVQTLNNEAAAVMRGLNISVLDNYSPIVGACGGVPNGACLGQKNCFCPHCPGVGYELIAKGTIAPRIRAMLQ